MYNVSTWGHRNPAEFRAAARKKLIGRYDTIQFADVAVTKVWKVEDIGEGKTGSRSLMVTARFEVEGMESGACHGCYG